MGDRWLGTPGAASMGLDINDAYLQVDRVKSGPLVVAECHLYHAESRQALQPTPVWTINEKKHTAVT